MAIESILGIGGLHTVALYYNQAICMRKRDKTLSALTQISQEELFSRARKQQQQPKSHGNCFISAITKARVALKEENHI